MGRAGVGPKTSPRQACLVPRRALEVLIHIQIEMDDLYSTIGQSESSAVVESVVPHPHAAAVAHPEAPAVIAVVDSPVAHADAASVAGHPEVPEVPRPHVEAAASVAHPEVLIAVVDSVVPHPHAPAVGHPDAPVVLHSSVAHPDAAAIAGHPDAPAMLIDVDSAVAHPDAPTAIAQSEASTVGDSLPWHSLSFLSFLGSLLSFLGIPSFTRLPPPSGFPFFHMSYIRILVNVFLFLHSHNYINL